MTRPEFRRFDFWVGDWDVTTLDGKAVGKSSVQRLLDGCALLENWTSSGGVSGKSLNSYNSDVQMWQQFWVAQGGSVSEYRQSEWVNGSLRLVARQGPLTGPGMLRMTFSPMNADLVRQLGEASADSGRTWSVQYDFYYHRRHA
jgi:hypothetical protein